MQSMQKPEAHRLELQSHAIPHRKDCQQVIVQVHTLVGDWLVEAGSDVVIFDYIFVNQGPISNVDLYR